MTATEGQEKAGTTAAGRTTETDGDQIALEQQPKVVLLSEYLNSVETDIRAAIYQRVIAQVNEGTIVGLVHLRGFVTIEMRNTDRVDSTAPRKVREVLLQNDVAMIDALSAIEDEVRLEVRQQMASRLDIDTVRQMAEGGNFEAMAQLAREKAQKLKRKRDNDRARTKGKKKPKAKRA